MQGCSNRIEMCNKKVTTTMTNKTNKITKFKLNTVLSEYKINKNTITNTVTDQSEMKRKKKCE